MSRTANLTANVLRWARESARITESDAAAKISVSVNKLREWENGISQPTIKQAQSLAQFYKRPFSLFFLPEIPNDFQPLRDFRRKTSHELSTSSTFIIREVQQKQSWLSELFKENKEPKLPFIGKYTINDNPSEIADDILHTFDINPYNYKTDNPIKEWIEKAESAGIFVSRTSFIHTRMKLDSEEIQGFAIADSYAPFVFINSEDWKAPQLFTLVHELAHLWIAETGISSEIEHELKDNINFHPVETFCNQVAANALIPQSLFEKIGSNVFNSGNDVFKVSKNLGISSFAFLLRALKLGLISETRYKLLKHEADKEYKAFLKREHERKMRQKNKEKKGGPNPYLMKLNRNGKLFTQTVFDAFNNNFIEPTQASFLLNTPVNKFFKFEILLNK